MVLFVAWSFLYMQYNIQMLCIVGPYPDMQYPATPPTTLHTPHHTSTPSPDSLLLPDPSPTLPVLLPCCLLGTLQLQLLPASLSYTWRWTHVQSASVWEGGSAKAGVWGGPSPVWGRPVYRWRVTASASNVCQPSTAASPRMAFCQQGWSWRYIHILRIIKKSFEKPRNWNCVHQALEIHSWVIIQYVLLILSFIWFDICTCTSRFYLQFIQHLVCWFCITYMYMTNNI